VRTTLDIDEDVLQAARGLAKRERKTIGELLSELARRGLAAAPNRSFVSEPKALYGLRPFPSRGGIVTNEVIDKIREDDAY
jgi:hypothetical protein